MALVIVLLYFATQQTEISIAEDVCSVRERTATTDIKSIFSPNFPNNYPDNVNCITRITSPENTVIELAFDSFQLEDSPSCAKDSLKIMDNEADNLLYPSCDDHFFWPHYPEKIVSRSNYMTITFVTDDQISDRGFNATFRAVQPSPHIMVMAENSTIRVTNRFNAVHFGFTPEEMTDPLACDYDPRTQFIFYSDRGTKNIGKFHAERHSFQTILHSQYIVEPLGLRIDVNSRLLYWTDAELGIISVSNLDGEYRHTLIDTELGKPGAVVTEPYNGYIYFTDWGTDPKIERADGDGQNRLILVNTFIHSPRTLAIDLKERTLYWIDGVQNSLEKVNYNGTGRTRLKYVSKEFEVFSLSLDDYAFFWSAYSSTGGSIRSIDRKITFNVKGVRWGSRKHYKGLSLRRQKESDDIVPDTCPTANCSGLCLPKPSGQYSCWTEDEVLPLIRSCPDDISVNLTFPGETEQTVTWKEPEISDNAVEGYWLVKPSSSGTAFPIGSTQITYIASDQFGNQAPCSFLVIVLGYAPTTATTKYDPQTNSGFLYLAMGTGGALIVFGLVAVTVMSVAVHKCRRRHERPNRNQDDDAVTISQTYFNNPNVTNFAHVESATNFGITPGLSVFGSSVQYYSIPETEPYYSDCIEVHRK